MAGERKGQARRTEVKQRGEMREEMGRRGMQGESGGRGKGRRGNNKEERVEERRRGKGGEERRVAGHTSHLYVSFLSNIGRNANNLISPKLNTNHNLNFKSFIIKCCYHNRPVR